MLLANVNKSTDRIYVYCNRFFFRARMMPRGCSKNPTEHVTRKVSFKRVNSFSRNSAADKLQRLTHKHRNFIHTDTLCVYIKRYLTDSGSVNWWALRACVLAEAVTPIAGPCGKVAGNLTSSTATTAANEHDNLPRQQTT